ncbi:hypothetical protein IGI04_003191 [Brassica rapa subsp. trilocularis]|uniref:Uncharacterized protein n=1 Tax=Brassica rapa subsp. trilocularis TaxID=1813537 RepID=A0ABQ7NXP2_BRACM|nr:hypothetical protein IGI04_003191 [Brassica rapa subsp. trilocularis]
MKLNVGFGFSFISSLNSSSNILHPTLPLCSIKSSSASSYVTGRMYPINWHGCNYEHRRIASSPSISPESLILRIFSPTETFEFPDYTFTKQEKKEKHAEIKSGLDEADVLIRKMNLEKDSKQVPSLDANQSTCEELMEPGMVDVHAVSVDQSGGFVMSKEKIDQSSDRMGDQQKTNPHAHTKLQSVDDAIDKRKRVLTSDHYVKKNDKRIVGSGIVALILAIILIIS